jgi:hypothetical protein
MKQRLAPKVGKKWASHGLVQAERRVWRVFVSPVEVCLRPSKDKRPIHTKCPNSFGRNSILFQTPAPASLLRVPYRFSLLGFNSFGS